MDMDEQDIQDALCQFNPAGANGKCHRLNQDLQEYGIFRIGVTQFSYSLYLEGEGQGGGENLQLRNSYVTPIRIGVTQSKAIPSP